MQNDFTNKEMSNTNNGYENSSNNCGNNMNID